MDEDAQKRFILTDDDMEIIQPKEETDPSDLAG